MSTYNSVEDKHWRDQGWHAEFAESGGVGRAKRDLFGFVDRVYLSPNGNIALVQITSKSNMNARVKKILFESTGHAHWRIRMAELARRLLKAGKCGSRVRLYVVGYELNEETYRYERHEREISFREVEDALSVPA